MWKRMRTRRFLLAATCLIGIAALTVGVVAARQRRARAHARALAEARATIKVDPASRRLLSCHLQQRRYRTLPRLRPTGFCLARRQGARLADEDILTRRSRVA